MFMWYQHYLWKNGHVDAPPQRLTPANDNCESSIFLRLHILTQISKEVDNLQIRLESTFILEISGQGFLFLIQNQEIYWLGFVFLIRNANSSIPYFDQ